MVATVHKVVQLVRENRDCKATSALAQVEFSHLGNLSTQRLTSYLANFY